MTPPALALVIEDDYDISIIFAKALRAAGYETQVIRSGDTALTWLSSTTPDLVILDLQLPRISGMEILRHIRADPRLTQTRVIIATAYPRLAEPLRGEADWVLIKPVNYGQLHSLARRFNPNVSPDTSSTTQEE